MYCEIWHKKTVITYKLHKPTTPIPMGRDDFYNEQINEYKTKGSPSRAVTIVNVLLFDLSGEVFIQKRSDAKKHNPGLYDKSMGGHIKYGDDPNYTVMVETIQELQVPSVTLNNLSDFKKTLNVLHDYLDTAAVIYEVDHFIGPFKKMIYGDEVVISNDVHFYLGVYNGSTKAVDKEAKGVLLYSLNELKREMKRSPKSFSYDLFYYLEHYSKEIDNLIKLLEKK